MTLQINYDKKILAKLKSNYFNAKILYETIKEKAEEIQRKILTENEFYETEKNMKMDKHITPMRITRTFDTYLMSEEDFQKYLDLCYSEYVRLGIADPRGKEYIPEAEERDLFFEAQKQLIEYAIDIIPDEFGEKETIRKAVRMIKYRDKVLDLVLRLESEEVENYAKN